VILRIIGIAMTVYVIATSLGASAPTVTLTGKAQSCYGGTPVRFVGVPGVNVSAFQISKVPLLMRRLEEIDTTNFTLGWPPRLDTLLRESDSLAKHSAALARAVSDSAGVFRLDIPATDSVLVYAVGHNEDEPINAVYTTLSGRTDKSFILDMASGGCGPMQGTDTLASTNPGAPSAVSWGRRVLWFYAIIGLVGMSVMAYAFWR
jgi:hypothetical protein